MYQDPRFRGAHTTGFGDRLRARWDRLARSGFVTVLGLLLLLTVGGTLWMAHIRGRIHQLTTTQESQEAQVSAVRPGGQEFVHLSRFEVSGSMVPEFTGATLAPGDGMLMLQAVLTLPGRGEIPVLLGTPEAHIAADGSNLAGGVFSATVETREGARWSAPVELIAGRASRQQNTAILPGGSRAEASFSPDLTTDGLSVHTGVTATVTTSLTNHGMDLSIVAKNTGPQPCAVTLSWRSELLAPSAGLQGVTILPPAQVSESLSSRADMQLGQRDVDQVFAALQRSYLSAGPELLLRNQADGYGLRFTALTPSIRSVQVKAAQRAHAVLLAFSTADGGKNTVQSRTVVKPGESLQWRLRVEAIPGQAPSTSVP